MIAKKDKWRAHVEECFRPWKQRRFAVDASVLFSPAKKSRGRKDIRKMACIVAEETDYEHGVPVWQSEYNPAPTLLPEDDFEEAEELQEAHFLASTKFGTKTGKSIRINPRIHMFTKTGAT
jgi:hypothetical protein